MKTFKQLERAIDRMPPGNDRAEFQKALTLFRRMAEAIELQDLIWAKQEAYSLSLVCDGLAVRPEVA